MCEKGRLPCERKRLWRKHPRGHLGLCESQGMDSVFHREQDGEGLVKECGQWGDGKLKGAN